MMGTRLSLPKLVMKKKVSSSDATASLAKLASEKGSIKKVKTTISDLNRTSLNLSEDQELTLRN
jgi:hypothetical protein